MEFISNKKNKAAIPLIWLLIYFSIIPMSLSNYVLCIGADGHVEFEIGVNGRCTDTHDSHEKPVAVMIAAANSGETHCGACIDFAIFLPLNAEAYLVPVHNPFIPSPTLAAALTTHPTRTSTLPTQPSFLDPPSAVDPILVSLRSIILLI